MTHATRQRALAWDGCVNVRDLGGHPTESGGETRFGAVVRADNVRRLSDEGWRSLVDYGVRTIVDLRFDAEVAADPPRRLAVDVVRVPLVPETGHPDWREIDALAAAAPTPADAQAVAYLELLERYRTSFAEAVATLARATNGAVLVHCEGGKDRTGLVAALLLLLAGVNIQDIATDYALSGDNLRGEIEHWIAEAANDDERARRTRIGTTRQESMVAVLEELERRYGDVGAYLRAGGVSDEELERARARLAA